MYSPKSNAVTLVGSTPAEAGDVEDALRRAGGSLTFEVKREPNAADSSFPLEAIHAIVLTPVSLVRATPTDVDAVRSADPHARHGRGCRADHRILSRSRRSQSL